MNPPSVNNKFRQYSRWCFFIHWRGIVRSEIQQKFLCSFKVKAHWWSSGYRCKGCWFLPCLCLGCQWKWVLDYWRNKEFSDNIRNSAAFCRRYLANSMHLYSIHSVCTLLSYPVSCSGTEERVTQLDPATWMMLPLAWLRAGCATFILRLSNFITPNPGLMKPLLR